MSKIKLQIDGFNYTLPVECVNEYNGKKRISVGAKNTAVMIRQYVKAKYPELSYWVNSESYSGGSSIRVYVCHKDGSKVDRAITNDLNNLCSIFEAGTFDGMTDSYNYKEPVKSDFSTEVSFLTRYIFVENKPKFGTIEYILRDLIDTNMSISEYLNSASWLTEKIKIDLAIKYEQYKSKK
jgi:hypothetical protein